VHLSRNIGEENKVYRRVAARGMAAGEAASGEMEGEKTKEESTA